MSARCDGIADCGNQKDETECELLADKIFSHDVRQNFYHLLWKNITFFKLILLFLDFFGFLYCWLSAS